VINLKTSSNRDGFEKFLTKLCVVPSGWESLLPILYNANWLHDECLKVEKNWPTINDPAVFNTKTGMMFRNALGSGEWEKTGDITYIKRLLADFGIWGLKNIDPETISELS